MEITQSLTIELRLFGRKERLRSIPNYQDFGLSTDRPKVTNLYQIIGLSFFLFMYGLKRRTTSVSVCNV
ncbi:hypothetical protein BpHYR1_020564 [Brachionus plicatilis]|uniref:Uncharacterized protein n=1 Tax=Brachionus plicatilis TaxID=10195 RepID=A0A3M7S884_BRAPC|nr:hypothetical protein BpHYR1_020564 [Brachionus plicatilis]